MKRFFYWLAPARGIQYSFRSIAETANTFTLRAVIMGSLLLSFVFHQSALGQAVSGNIVGTVDDPSGGVVPGADISIIDVERGIHYSTTSNADGNYTQTHLLAGHYRLKVMAPGFTDFVTTVDVQVDATTRVDVQFQLGKSETAITVNAETPLLKTDRADVSTTLSENELGKLPALNRNLTQLLLVIPGAQMNGYQHASSENPQGGIQIDVNGQFFFTNGFQLDGTENQSAILGIAVINPNIDSVEDYKVTTSNYDAEFGQAAGALQQVTTKSGTNNVHGTIFEYLRNNFFNSANPFLGATPPLHFNQFGGSAGGPIKRDKLFLFGDYQGTRRHTGAGVVTTVPTAAERAGDLRALLGAYICSDGTTSSAPCPNPVLVTTTEGASAPAQAGMVFDPTTGNPDGTGRRAISSGGQVNVLPAIAAPMAKLLGFLPLPNTGGVGALANNYIASGIEQFSDDQYDVRMDYAMSEKSHIFGRYTISNFNKHAPGAFGEEAGGPALNGINFAGHSTARNQSLALGWTYLFSPTLITDVRFGTYRYRVRVYPNGVDTTPAKDAGLPGLNTGTPETSGMPAFYVNGDGGFNFGYSLNVNQCNCPLKETENHFQWVNNWTKIHGNHEIKWGLDIRRAQQQRVPSDSHRSGEITFAPSVTGSADVDAAAMGNATTGEGLAAYLLGLPSNFARYFTGIGFYPGLRQTRLFFFAQDSWRVTPKLTLNYGLRYENYLPQRAAKPGGAGSFDPNTGEVLAAGIGSVPLNMGVKPYNLGFLPRLGFAYRWVPSTVIRAGYGQTFSPSAFGSVFGQSPDYSPPITNPQSLVQSGQYLPVLSLLSGPPIPVNPPVGANGRYLLPNGIGTSYFFDPPSAYRIPGAYFWNLSVQHEFTSTFSVELAYIGNVGRHLYVNPNINQAVPGPGSLDSRRPFFAKFGLEQGISETCNCDNSSYHGLQAKVAKRASHGLDFLLTYTYGKAMTNTESGNSPANNYDFHGDHGPASWDRTHQLTLTNNYDLPFGRGRRWAANVNKFVDLVIGGWQLNGVSTVGSGLAFTPTVSNAPLLNDSDFSSVRPDVIANPNVSNPNANEWFNPAAYTSPQQPFRNGTASKSSLRGPAEYLFNLALAKTFTITERKTLEFRWENFNAFNIDNLGLPNATVDVAGAGTITSTATDMRQMQFGLHFRF